MKKYIVTREGVYARVYAVVGRDGTVLWNPQPFKATELSASRASEVAKQHKAEVAEAKAVYKRAFQTGDLLVKACGGIPEEEDHTPCTICPDCTEKADKILIGLRAALGLA